MARTYDPQDACTLLSSILAQLYGGNLATVTTDNFLSAGERALAAGTENVLNALSIPLLKTIIAARPYNEQFGILDAVDTGTYSDRIRKISFYSKWPMEDGAHNTQVWTNLANGFTHGQNPDALGNAQSTKSMWEQVPPAPIEFNFGGSSVWQDGITRYKDQIDRAFTSPGELSAFYAGVMTEKGNDIKQQKEAYRRAIVLNRMAMAAIDQHSINLTTEYNTYMNPGTPYTTQQLLTTELDSFLKWFVAELKLIMVYMEKRNMYMHYSPTHPDGLVLLRHTPRDRMRLMLNTHFMAMAESRVMPEIFNTGYLDIGNYESVPYWQTPDSPYSIDVTPSVHDHVTGMQITGSNVALDTVIGYLYDVDAMMTCFQLDDALATPMEARKRYSTIWYSMARNGLNDSTEKSVLLYMED